VLFSSVINSFFKRNIIEFIIFSILVIVVIGIISHQLSVSPTERGLIGGDEPRYLLVTSTILKHNSLDLEKSILDSDPDPKLFLSGKKRLKICEEGKSYGRLGPDGICYSKHGIGTSLVLIPGFLFGGILGSMVQVGLVFGMIGVVMYKFSSKLTTKRFAFIATMLTCLSTSLLTFSSEILSEIQVALILISILYLFFFKPHNFRYTGVIGILLGSMLFFKLSFAVFIVVLLPLFCYLLFNDKKNRKKIPVFLGFFMIIVISFYVFQLLTGPEGTLGGGVTGEIVTSGSYRLDDDLAGVANGLANYLFSSHYGFFTFAPLLLVSIFGFPILWNKNRAIAISSVLLFSFFIIIHSWGFPHAGNNAFPTRYLVPLIPLTAAPLALLLEKFWKNPIFLGFLIVTSIIGSILSYHLLRKSNQHGRVEFKIEVLERVYFGLVEFFPTRFYLEGGEKALEISPFFLLAVIGITVFFLFFVFHPYFKKYTGQSIHKI